MKKIVLTIYHTGLSRIQIRTLMRLLRETNKIKSIDILDVDISNNK